MGTEENRALVRRLYDEGVNRQDAAASARFYALDISISSGSGTASC